ncbi:hypothetical protein LGK97_08245 [Clostridium sp. CS001]|uniref:hypothetical protein n=1 Tax=Clostridium sp. CS001 TaxID=2880648 RepID=UPI001CF1F0A3|nr:hypothetical protein [Clostridium sp. CS001]MCB2289754.1 hypothetical protein [Clostridium sp. CS001]
MAKNIKEKQVITREYKEYMQKKLLGDYNNLFKIIMYSLNGLCFNVHAKTFLEDMETPDGKKLPKTSLTKLLNNFEMYGLVDILTFHKNRIIKLKAPVYTHFNKKMEINKLNKSEENSDNKNIKVSYKTTNASHYNYLQSALIGEILCSNWQGYSTYVQNFITTNLSFNLETKSYTFLNNVQKFIKKNADVKELPILERQKELLKKRYNFKENKGYKIVDGKLINAGKGEKLDLGISSAEKVDYLDFALLSYKNIFLEKITYDKDLNALIPEFAILNFTELTPKKIADYLIKVWRFANQVFGDIEGKFYPIIKVYSLTSVAQPNKDRIYKYIEVDNEFTSDGSYISLDKKRIPLKANIKTIFQFIDFDASSKLLSNKLISSIL